LPHDEGEPDPLANSLEVDSAAGMVSLQAHCTIDEAFALMRDRAERTHRSVERVANDVLERVIRFD
jgi:AmiR/NasT family two-component response regulator